MPNDGAFKTDDMALATVLIGAGLKYTLEMLPYSAKAVWVFAVSDRLDEIVDEYEERRVRVEPRDFVERYAGVRRKLYDFLQENGVRQTRSRRTDAPSSAAASA